MKTALSNSYTNMTSVPQSVVMGASLIRAAAIWLLPVAIVSTLLLGAFLMLSDESQFNERLGGAIFFVLIMVAGVSAVACPMAASIGVFLLTTRAAEARHRKSVLPPRVLVRASATLSAMLTVGLCLTGWLANEQEVIVETVVLVAFIPVLTLLATSLSVHVDRLSHALGFTGDPGARIRERFAPRVTASVGIVCIATSIALRLFGGGTSGSTYALPIILEGVALLIMIAALMGASNDVDRLYSLLRSRPRSARARVKAIPEPRIQSSPQRRGERGR